MQHNIQIKNENKDLFVTIERPAHSADEVLKKLNFHIAEFKEEIDDLINDWCKNFKYMLPEGTTIPSLKVYFYRDFWNPTVLRLRSFITELFDSSDNKEECKRGDMMKITITNEGVTIHIELPAYSSDEVLKKLNFYMDGFEEELDVLGVQWCDNIKDVLPEGTSMNFVEMRFYSDFWNPFVLRLRSFIAKLFHR